MPYEKFNKQVMGNKKYCIKNLDTGKETCFSSKKKRKTGIRIREAFAHGWKPIKMR